MPRRQFFRQIVHPEIGKEYIALQITDTDSDRQMIERLFDRIDGIIKAIKNGKPNSSPDAGEALQTTISFYVDRYYITEAQKKNLKSVATFLATHPDINLIVTGYADVETAYPAYNLRLSQKRAQAVYDMLVNDFHVPANRLRIDFKGDTVQPYASVNEWNRAVIFFLDRGDRNSQILESEPTESTVE